MVGKSVCAVCGNELNPSFASCPFCKTPRETEHGKKGGDLLRVVNLERGMPLVHDALQRLTLELETASRTGLRVLVLIHGYGSSGRGGAIKEAVRRQLQYGLDRRTLNDVLPGEECGKRLPHARQLLRRFPFLKQYMQAPNPGITLVVI